LRIKAFIAAVFGVAFMAAVPAFAHHSFAMFDNSKLITLEGKVVEYRWENPHTHIIVKVPPGAKDPAMVGTWDIEGASINIMARQGWTKISYKAGDPIIAVGHPLKSGDKGQSLSYVILPDGTRRYQDVNRPGAQAADKPAN
jgi:hypothetical protein